jgi:hypothetical protein
MGYVTRYPTEPDDPSWPDYNLAQCKDTEHDQPIDGIKLEVSALHRTRSLLTSSQSHRPDGLPPLVMGTGTFSNLYDESASVTDDLFLRMTRLSLRYGVNAFDTGVYLAESSTLLTSHSTPLSPVRDHPRQSPQGASDRVPSRVVPDYHQDGQIQPDAQGPRSEREHDALVCREELEAFRDGLSRCRL